jgi:DnaJ-domain-containing protein 1
MSNKMNKKTLERIGSRPRGAGAAPFMAAGALVAALATSPFSLTAALVVLVVGLATTLLVYARRVRRRTVPVRYDLREDEAARFADVRRACEALAASSKVWRVAEGPERLREPAREIEVTRCEPPGIRANVEVWGIDLGDSQLFFMPDTVLLLEDDRYRAISYASFDVDFAPEFRKEEGELPSDAEVTGRTWQHVREDVKPDRRRFPRNPRLTEVMYGLLEISGPHLKARLRISNRNAAMRFARTLGAEGYGSAGDKRNGTRNGNGKPRTGGTGEEMRLELAYGILGLQASSSKDQVTAAYRKLAKLHHPDLLQDREPGARELAEERMRLINEAYTNLKRQTM